MGTTATPLYESRLKPSETEAMSTCHMGSREITATMIRQK